MLKQNTLVLAVTLFMLGCSSKPARIGPRPPASYEVVGPSKGGGCGLLFLGLIPLGVNSRTERAYAEAIHGKGSDLINTEIQYSWWYVPYLGTIHCTTVTGTVVR
jgi:hypothetical protein